VTIEAVLGAEGVDRPPGPTHLFRVDVSEVVITRVGDPPDHLVIGLWRDGEGLRRMRRE
jgi:hypothetical protein